MSNDPAYYLAYRARQQYAVSPRATMRELLRICRARGIAVEFRPGLAGPGYFLTQPAPTIVLKHRNRPWVLAHELLHAWVSENIREGVVYAFSDYADDDVERAAERFACLLCGTFQERAQAVLGFER